MPDVAVKASLPVQPAPGPGASSTASSTASSSATTEGGAEAALSADAGAAQFASVLQRHLANLAPGAVKHAVDAAKLVAAEGETGADTPAAEGKLPAELTLLANLLALPVTATAAPAAVPQEGSPEAATLPAAPAAAAKDGATFLPPTAAASTAAAAKLAAAEGGEAVAVAEPLLPGETPLPAAASEPGFSDRLQGALQAANPQATAPQAPPPHAARIATPVGQPGWDGEVGNSVVLMLGRGASQAELVLTPPHLGRIEVTLSVSGDQTNALFVSANPAVRDALEQAMPRLREALAEAGVTLGEASVNAESRGQEQNPGRSGRQGAPAMGLAEGAPPQWFARSNGLVDTFA